jgi:hypothetical protein
MFVTAPVGGPRTLALIRHVVIGMVDADNADAHGIASGGSELVGLLDEIANHAVDLLDHRLGEYLHLGADLNSGNRTSGAYETWNSLSYLPRDDLAKRPIAAAGSDTMRSVLNIKHTLTSINSCVQSNGNAKCMKVLGQTPRDGIAQAGIAMSIPRSLKQTPKTVQ